MQRSWGVNESAHISGLGDDLWLLRCQSSAEVDRIMSLGRTRFGTSQVFFDKWTLTAGRTEVLGASQMMWILARGIPLHLRSVDLFRQIGDLCGGYIDHDNKNCLFNSVRIKVGASSSCPEYIPLHFREESFIIDILQDCLSSPAVRSS
ncbi:hypothetical protein LINPERPRIM_LOCUS30184 [Linum perenne]